MTDICIIGGGASGMAAAIAAKLASPRLDITLIERNERVGKKLALTGNGRCNISNKEILPEHYHGEDISFCEKAFSLFDLSKTQAFFEKMGVLFKEGEKGKLYPYSLQASSVVDAMRLYMERLGIRVILNQEVGKITKSSSLFSVFSEEKLKAKAVIIAAGGKSGGKIASSKGYELLSSLGHGISALSPAIVQIKTDNSLTRQLKGIKIDAKVTVIKKGEPKNTDFGEVLFCDYGLSGPPILQLSRYLKKGDEISLDIMPEYSASELCQILRRRLIALHSVSCSDFFAGMLQKRLGQVLLKSLGFSISSPAQFSSNQIKQIAEKIKDFRFVFEDTNGFQNAQVTHGGAKTKEFFGENMMSKKIEGLFACGEILDIDGDCGGFNLQWAWSSGYIAGKAAARFAEENRCS